MSETPPPYANYPRNTATYGSAAALQSLADGYFGLSKVFVINIVIAIATNVLTRTGSVPLVGIGLIVLVVGLVVGFLTYGPNKKIGEGAGWTPAQPVIASILMGINSALCCGIVGYVVMQTIAVNHMKRYGIKGGFLGVKKSDVALAVGQLESQGRTY